MRIPPTPTQTRYVAQRSTPKQTGAQALRRHILGHRPSRPGTWNIRRPGLLYGRGVGSRLSERRFVVELAPLGAALAVAAAGGPLGAGGRPFKAGGDLVGVDLGHRPLLTLGGLPRAGPQPPEHDGAVALGQGLGDVLGLVPPGVDPEVAGVPVPPGPVGLADALVDRQAEVGHRRAVLGVAQLGVVGQVADLDGEVVACHRVLLLLQDAVGIRRSVGWIALVPAAPAGPGVAPAAVGVAAVQTAAALPPGGRGAGWGGGGVWRVVGDGLVVDLTPDHAGVPAQHVAAALPGAHG